MFREQEEEEIYQHQRNNLGRHGNNEDDGSLTEYHHRDKSSSILQFLRNNKIYIAIFIVAFIICIGLLIGLIVYNIVSKPNIVDHVSDRRVLMISIDGFRPDYLDMFKDDCKNLTRVFMDGVRAKTMKPIFPSKTFPNHYTIVTGLYAESHGIVSNS